MAHSTRSKSAKKPGKPKRSFPLFKHQSGRWCKKVRSQFCYFGKVADDPDGKSAKALWNLQKEDLLAGREPRISRQDFLAGVIPDDDGLTVHQLCNKFYDAKQQQAAAGNIVERSAKDYHPTCQKILKAFGKSRLVDDLTSRDFAALHATLAKDLNPTSLANEIRRVRAVFNYAYKEGLIDRPVRFGTAFVPPSKKSLRLVRQRHQQKYGLRMLEARQLRRLLKASNPTMRAMILLAANAGLGNTDCARLPLSALDLKGGWLNYPRPKTAVERRAKLWPETIDAIKQYLAVRPDPLLAEHDHLLFITRWGKAWFCSTAENPVNGEFKKLLLKLKLHRKGLGFYCLRHGFETVAGETMDQVAVNAIMGHVDGSMAGAYRERISDARLQSVSDFVRSWLFRRTSPDLWQSRREREGGA